MSTQYRHEQKYICSAIQIKHLLGVLSVILPKDIHQNGVYHVKSLYFDTKEDRFLEESLDGVKKRSKYRLRRYDQDKKNVKFECKSSLLQLKQKRFVWLTPKELEMVLSGKVDKIVFDNPLLSEFYCLRKTEQLESKLVIDYDRIAFVQKDLNVRVTLDQKIICSDNVDSFLDNKISGGTILPNNAGILEVKFDDVLPTYIIQILGLEDLEQTAFSKYVMGRLAYKRSY